MSLAKPTLRQEELIARIEDELPIQFSGTTSREASDFIREAHKLNQLKKACMRKISIHPGMPVHSDYARERMADAMYEAESYGDK